MSEMIVRPYTRADREGVFRIAADTAFFGEPLETFMEDRRLFCEAFYAYYTDVEPETGWVASDGRQVVGFIVGSLDTDGQRARWFRKVLPGVMRSVLIGRYHIGRRTLRYMTSLAQAAVRNEFPSRDTAHYPAHLHINLDKDWRGFGLGRRLVDSYLTQLRVLNVSGVHLETTSLNEAAIRLYTKVGFSLLDARRTHLWASYFDQPVENRCYGLQLKR